MDNRDSDEQLTTINFMSSADIELIMQQKTSNRSVTKMTFLDVNATVFCRRNRCAILAFLSVVRVEVEFFYTLLSLE